MSNKNKTGIDNFLNHQKLFSRDKVSYSKILTGYRVGDAAQGAKGTPSKAHHYHLLPEVSKDNRFDKSSPTQHRDSSELAEYADNYNNRSVNSSNVNAAKKIDVYATPSPQSRSRIQQSKSDANNAKVNQKLSGSDQNSIKKNSPNISQSLQLRPVEKVRQTSPNQSLRKRQALSRQASFTAVQIPAVQEQSPSMQALVIKSSRKYFDSCRGQALDYIAKMQKMLCKQNQFLSQSLQKINKDIQQSHNSMAEQLKQNLYRIIDESVQQWKLQELAKFDKQQINYIGQLLQLNTQVEQRYKQMGSYRQDLDDDRQWKNRASDLLTSNYEADLLELSKMCKKSVEHSQDSVRQYLDISMHNASARVMGKEQAGQLGANICLLLSTDATKDNHKQTQPNKQAEKKQQDKKQEQITNQLKTARKQPLPIHQPINKTTYLNPPVRVATPTFSSTKPKQYQPSLSHSQHMRQRRMTTLCQTCHRQIAEEDTTYPNKADINHRLSYQQQQSSPTKRTHTFNSAREGEAGSHLMISRSSQLNLRHETNAAGQELSNK